MSITWNTYHFVTMNSWFIFLKNQQLICRFMIHEEIQSVLLSCHLFWNCVLLHGGGKVNEQIYLVIQSARTTVTMTCQSPSLLKCSSTVLHQFFNIIKVSYSVTMQPRSQCGNQEKCLGTVGNLKHFNV